MILNDCIRKFIHEQTYKKALTKCELDGILKNDS